MAYQTKIRSVKRLCPDDVRAGQYVMVMHESFEYVWPGCVFGSRGLDVQRVTVLPCETAMPVRIEEVCVPFLLVRDARGKGSIVDTRRVHLARVSKRFGRAAFDAARCKAKKKGR